jgi:hypothetical protein
LQKTIPQNTQNDMSAPSNLRERAEKAVRKYRAILMLTNNFTGPAILRIRASSVARNLFPTTIADSKTCLCPKMKRFPDRWPVWMEFFHLKGYRKYDKC